MSAKYILILEDNADLRHLYGKALSQSGYVAYPAATLQEAHALLDGSRFDVFLCDIQVGDERGTDLLREKQATLSQQGTQVIIMSAFPRYRPLCEEMGVAFFLEKPVAISTLLTLVERLTA